ncbi:MAG: general secretion pathway protein GspK [bacterium]
MSRQNKKIGQEKGVALLVTIWIITILVIVAFEFSAAMRLESYSVKNYQEEAQLYALACGAYERALWELSCRHDPFLRQKRRDLIREEIPAEKKEWLIDGRPYTFSLGQGICQVRIYGEAGKININLASDRTLRQVAACLGLEGESKDILVDSILDWRDPDDFYRPHGAENDYYRSLKEPYDCKNGYLATIEELLLVRGVSKELFWGKKILFPGEKEERMVGLKDIFSVYAAGEQIDLNAAGWPVLRCFLGLPGEVADKVIVVREEREFENLTDLTQRVPEIQPFLKEIGRFISFRPLHPYYTVETRAWIREDELGRGLKAIIKIDVREKNGYKVIQWIDHIS